MTGNLPVRRKTLAVRTRVREWAGGSTGLA